MEWLPPVISAKHQPVQSYVVIANTEGWNEEWPLNKLTTKLNITGAPLCSDIRVGVASKGMTLKSQYIYSSAFIGLPIQS